MILNFIGCMIPEFTFCLMVGAEGYDFRDGKRLDVKDNNTYSTYLYTSRAQQIVKHHNQSQVGVNTFSILTTAYTYTLLLTPSYLHPPPYTLLLTPSSLHSHTYTLILTSSCSPYFHNLPNATIGFVGAGIV